MANNLTIVQCNKVLDTTVKCAAFTTPTSPIKLRLMSTQGDATSAGTESTGGSYPAGGVTTLAGFGTPAAGSVTNSASAFTFTGMPAGNVAGIELWDASPARFWQGVLTGGTKTLGAGDTLTFATSSITITMT